MDGEVGLAILSIALISCLVVGIILMVKLCFDLFI